MAGSAAPREEAAARAALLTYMRSVSEDRWAAGWYSDLEYAIAGLGDGFDSSAFHWLVDRAGGWWAWDDGHIGKLFVEGSYKDLLRQAAAAGWRVSDGPSSPGAPAPVAGQKSPGAWEQAMSGEDVSWETMARRLWSVRYKALVFVGVVAFVNVVERLLSLSQNDGFWIAAPLAFLLLVPDARPWRIPLRSRKSLWLSRHSGPPLRSKMSSGRVWRSRCSCLRSVAVSTKLVSPSRSSGIS